VNEASAYHRLLAIGYRLFASALAIGYSAAPAAAVKGEILSLSELSCGLLQRLAHADTPIRRHADTPLRTLKQFFLFHFAPEDWG
jgi:hypothetical protein